MSFFLVSITSLIDLVDEESFLVLQFMILLLTSSISAALAIAEVGKKGNSHAGWLPVCGQVHKFCDHVKGALISGFSAAVLYLVLLLYSIHILFDSKT